MEFAGLRFVPSLKLCMLFLSLSDLLLVLILIIMLCYTLSILATVETAPKEGEMLN